MRSLPIYKLVFLWTLTIIGPEIFSTALIPAILGKYSGPSFMGIFVLFLGLKHDGLLRPFIILGLNILHGAFNTTGWAMGTFLGISLTFVIVRLREVIQLKSGLSLSLFSFLFHIIWFCISTFIILMKTNQYHLFGKLMVPMIIQSFLLGIFTPLMFKWLDFIWPISTTENEMV